MRFEVYDEERKLFRKFWTRHEASQFIQPGWIIVEKAKQDRKSTRLNSSH